MRWTRRTSRASVVEVFDAVGGKLLLRAWQSGARRGRQCGNFALRQARRHSECRRDRGLRISAAAPEANVPRETISVKAGTPVCVFQAMVPCTLGCGRILLGHSGPPLFGGGSFGPRQKTSFERRCIRVFRRRRSVRGLRRNGWRCCRRDRKLSGRGRVLHLLAGRGQNGLVSMPERVEEAILAANEAVFSRAQENKRLSGMGTTLVALGRPREPRLGAEHRRQPLLSASREGALNF